MAAYAVGRDAPKLPWKQLQGFTCPVLWTLLQYKELLAGCRLFLRPCVAARTKLLRIRSHICLPEWQKWNICCFLLHLNLWKPVGLILLMHQGVHVCHLPVRGFFTSNIWANLLITEGLHTDYCDYNLANTAFITNGDAGDGKPSLILRSPLKSNKIKRNKICAWICYQTFEKHKSGTLPMLLLAIFHSGASFWGKIRSGSAFFVSGISIMLLCTNGGLTIIWRLLYCNYCMPLLHLQSIF